MMKRMLPLLLALLLCTSCAAPREAAPAASSATPSPYEAAETLLLSGDYEAAAEAFSALTGVNDAPQMAIYCRGMALAASGDYDTASLAFAALGDFKDSATQAAWCAGVSAQTKAEAARQSATAAALEQALVHLDAAEEAFAGLVFLPDVPGRLAACRELRAEVEAVLPGLRIARQYDSVAASSDGSCYIVERDGKYGLLDVQGNVLLPCENETIVNVSGELMVVEKRVDGQLRCGVVNMAGQQILPLEYLGVWFVGNYIEAVGLESLKPLWYTRTGESVEPPQAMWNGEYILEVEAEDLTAAAEAAHAAILEAQRQSAWVRVTLQEDEGEAGEIPAATLTILTGCMAADGSWTLQPDAYEGPSLYLLREYAVLTSPDGTSAAYDIRGSKLFDSQWAAMYYAGDGLFGVVNAKGLLGFADSRGNVAIPCQYVYEEYLVRNMVSGVFSGGMAVVQGANGLYGCIDTAGGTVIAFQWEEMAAQGPAVLGIRDETVTLMTRTGQVVKEGIPEDADASFAVTGESFALALDGQLTIWDAAGNVIF